MIPSNNPTWRLGWVSQVGVYESFVTNTQRKTDGLPASTNALRSYRLKLFDYSGIPKLNVAGSIPVSRSED